jgi:hypothetical protein
MKELAASWSVDSHFTQPFMSRINFDVCAFCMWCNTMGQKLFPYHPDERKRRA